jgi:hypothetical protein
MDIICDGLTFEEVPVEVREKVALAEPILSRPPPHNPRETLYRRLGNAPHQHAEALLMS